MPDYKVYAGMPYKYRAKLARYYDILGSGTITEDTTESKTFEDYPPMDNTVELNNNQYIVNIAGGELPDYTYTDSVIGVLATAGANYLAYVNGYFNYNIVGTPTIDTITGVISGFSASSYITLPVLSGTDFILTQKLNFNGQNQEQCIWFSSRDRPIAFYNGKLGVYQSSWQQGSTVYTAGVYWVRAVYNDKALELYCLADNDYTLSNLPDVSEWNKELELTLSTNPFDVQIQLSRNNSTYWRAEMYLSGSEIKTSTGEVLWSPYGENASILPGILYESEDTATETNYWIQYINNSLVLTPNSGNGSNWVGNCTIPEHTVVNYQQANINIIGNGVKIADSIADSFNTTAYLTSTVSVPDISVSGALRFFTRVNTITGSTCAFLGDASGHMVGLLNNGRWRIWDTSSKTSGTSVTNGQWYWVRVDFNATTSILYYLADDGTYTNASDIPEDSWTHALAANFAMSAGILYIGYNQGNSAEYWRGSIDLSKTSMQYDENSSGTYTDYWQALGS